MAVDKKNDLLPGMGVGRRPSLRRKSVEANNSGAGIYALEVVGERGQLVIPETNILQDCIPGVIAASDDISTQPSSGESPLEATLNQGEFEYREDDSSDHGQRTGRPRKLPQAYTFDQAYRIFPHLFFTHLDPKILLVHGYLEQDERGITQASIDKLEKIMDGWAYLRKDMESMAAAIMISTAAFSKRFGRLKAQMTEEGIVKNLGGKASAERIIYNCERRAELEDAVRATSGVYNGKKPGKKPYNPNAIKTERPVVQQSSSLDIRISNVHVLNNRMEAEFVPGGEKNQEITCTKLREGFYEMLQERGYDAAVKEGSHAFAFTTTQYGKFSIVIMPKFRTDEMRRQLADYAGLLR